ncbi:hypothetical protein [Shimia ponticola]|uniref:hypothetical protein n=1 Tax=Shimia ponticola TaxID=2582893 RepID=UPI001C9A5EE7|nr:hypothetical protein [Shimia ponticola]
MTMVSAITETEVVIRYQTSWSVDGDTFLETLTHANVQKVTVAGVNATAERYAQFRSSVKEQIGVRDVYAINSVTRTSYQLTNKLNGNSSICTRA